MTFSQIQTYINKRSNYKTVLLDKSQNHELNQSLIKEKNYQKHLQK